MENNEELLLTETCEITNDGKLLKEQEWKREHEIILVEWADKAMCYRWLHTRSHQAYLKQTHGLLFPSSL